LALKISRYEHATPSTPEDIHVHVSVMRHKGRSVQGVQHLSPDLLEHRRIGHVVVRQAVDAGSEARSATRRNMWLILVMVSG